MEKNFSAIRREYVGRGKYADVYYGDEMIGHVDVGFNCAYYDAEYNYDRVYDSHTGDAGNPLEAGIAWVKARHGREYPNT